jgi:F-box protein 11
MSTALLYCDSCGAANRVQARFCIACGASLQGISSLQSSPVHATLTGRLNLHTLLRQRYRVLNLLGQGGMGAVYKAEDLLFSGDLRAVKEMSQSGLSSYELQNATEAFQHEAHLLAQLHHESLPHIYDHFNEDGRWYLVMDYLAGETLEAHLRRLPGNACQPQEALNIGIQLCDALSYLHTHQPPVIFRDLKPANIILTPDDKIHLIDFGIARLFKPGQATDTMALGSPGYAAPEQYGRAQTSASSDIYSLGATLHEMLTGYDPCSSPFQFPPLNLTSLPGGDELNTLVLQMVEIKQDKRPASALEVKQRLQKIAQRLAPPVQPQTLSVAAAAALPIQSIMAQSGPQVATHIATKIVSNVSIPTSTLMMPEANDIVVDRNGQGDYDSIREALRHVSANTRILVYPGVYRGLLTLDRPVHLQAAGPREHTMLESFDESCLAMQTTSATVRGFTLNGRIDSRTNPFSTVDIYQGELLLEQCDVSSESLACITIYGKDANPTIRNCIIHDGHSDGIAITEHARGLIEECEIARNALAGVTIALEADPVLRRCKIYDGQLSGIYIYKRGRGKIEACDIYRNTLPGIAITQEGHPLVQQCSIHDGKQHGIFITEYGRGSIEHCQIFANAFSGVAIAKEGNPNIQHCQIYNNARNGISARDRGYGTIEHCEIKHNQQGAWQISDDAQIIRLDNVVV